MHKWPSTATLAFDYGNGTIANETLKYNETIDYPENLKREGYTFNGWNPRPERMPAHDTTVVAQWAEDDVAEYVEIIFGTKDIAEKDVENLVRRFTGEEFTIIKFEGTTSGEVRAIIKFKDAEAAKEFVDKLRASSDSDVEGVVKVSFSLEKIKSDSLGLTPFLALGYALL